MVVAALLVPVAAVGMSAAQGHRLRVQGTTWPEVRLSTEREPGPGRKAWEVRTWLVLPREYHCRVRGQQEVSDLSGRTHASVLGHPVPLVGSVCASQLRLELVLDPAAPALQANPDLSQAAS